MCRYLLLLMMSVSTMLKADPKPYEGAIMRLEKDYRNSLSELATLGVADALGLEKGFGYITDEKAMYRLPALYWVQTQKEELIKLNENEITIIPVALNNILENVAEFGWDKHIQISDEEFQNWRKEKRNFSFQYVDTDLKGDRLFKQIDPLLYMKAEKIYNQAMTDATSLEENTEAHKTAISIALEKYYKSHVELSLIYKLQNLTTAANRARKKANTNTIGEHNSAPLNSSNK